MAPLRPRTNYCFRAGSGHSSYDGVAPKPVVRERQMNGAYALFADTSKHRDTVGGGLAMLPGPWNWLEIAKLAVGGLTPILLAGLGVYIHFITKRFENLLWRNQKLIEKRLAIYDDLAPLLNNVLCYFTYVGNWREHSPPEIVSVKRKIDQKLHLAAPLFSEEFFVACTGFQHLCFKTYTGWGRDALLRSNFERRRQACGSAWNVEWDAFFSADVSDPDDVRAAYQRAMEVFARDIGVHPKFVVPDSGTVPRNIR